MVRKPRPDRCWNSGAPGRGGSSMSATISARSMLPTDSTRLATSPRCVKTGDGAGQCGRGDERRRDGEPVGRRVSQDAPRAGLLAVRGTRVRGSHLRAQVQRAALRVHREVGVLRRAGSCARVRQRKAAHLPRVRQRKAAAQPKSCSAGARSGARSIGARGLTARRIAPAHREGLLPGPLRLLLLGSRGDDHGLQRVERAIYAAHGLPLRGPGRCVPDPDYAKSSRARPPNACGAGPHCARFEGHIVCGTSCLI
jgi:hypothetical protein